MYGIYIIVQKNQIKAANLFYFCVSHTFGTFNLKSLIFRTLLIKHSLSHSPIQK